MEEKSEVTGLSVQEYQDIIDAEIKAKQEAEEAKRRAESGEDEEEKKRKEEEQKKKKLVVKPPPQPWMCIACTFRNAAVNNICEICSTPKPTAEQTAALNAETAAAAEPIGEWDCEVCTFANSHGGTVCQMCGTAKASE